MWSLFYYRLGLLSTCTLLISAHFFISMHMHTFCLDLLHTIKHAVISAQLHANTDNFIDRRGILTLSSLVLLLIIVDIIIESVDSISRDSPDTPIIMYKTL